MPAHRSSELPRMAEARPALMQRTGCDGQADTPTKVTLAGWRAVLRAVASRFSKDRVMDEAASVAFYTLLALFPALAALVALYGLVANPSGLFGRLDLVPSLVPNWGVQILQQVLRSLTARSRHTLGLGLAVSLVTALWSSNRGIRSLFRALNAVHGVREERGFLHFTAVTLGFTAGALVLMVVALAGVIALPIVLARVGYAGTGTWLLRVLRWPLLMAATEDARQRVRRDRLDAGVHLLLLVCGASRTLRRDVWLARSGDRLHDLGLAVGNRAAGRRRARRGGGSAVGA